MNREPVYTPEEVAKYLKVNVITIVRSLRSGDLKGFKIGLRLWRITESSLNDFMKGGTGGN